MSQRPWIRRDASGLLTTLVLLLAPGVPAGAAPPTPGNVLVVVNVDAGVFFPPRVAEFTQAGLLVQSFGEVPAPGGTEPSSERTRDLVAGGKGFFLYNGTFAPSLAEFDFATGAWAQTTFAGWNTVNNVTYGGIARHGDFVYVTDTEISSDPTSGIVRFDTKSGGAIRFADGYDTIDLSLGLDGFLYALLSNEREIIKLDPVTLELIDTIELSGVFVNGIAVDSDGRIYGVGSQRIYRVTPEGTVERALDVSAFAYDIDLAPDGRLVSGTRVSDGKVVLSDTRLETFTVFGVGRFRATFVAFVPEPENQPPDCSGATAEPAEIWPPDQKLQAVSIAGVSDPDADPLTVTVTGIAQNEPLEGFGTGKSCPDGHGIGTDTPLVRAERSGAIPADGRVYHVRFEAEDGRGGRCSGAVRVCVPHDRRRACGDPGELLDSTACGN